MADWTPEEIQRIWEKGKVCPPNDPNVWRKDQCGAWMYRSNHGAPSANESHILITLFQRHYSIG